jgi:hypothetical protein
MIEYHCSIQSMEQRGMRVMISTIFLDNTLDSSIRRMTLNRAILVWTLLILKHEKLVFECVDIMKEVS